MMTSRYWVRVIRDRWVSRLALVCLPVVLAASGATSGPAGLSLLAGGIKSLERQDAPQAEKALKQAVKALPLLKDYTSFYLGQAQYLKGDFSDAAHTLEAVWKMEPRSPLVSRAVLLAAQAKIQTGDAGDAVKLIRKHQELLQRPQADLVLAMASEGAGDNRTAAESYQQVFYYYPNSTEAAQADTALGRLRASMGGSFPDPAPAMVLLRAQKLMETGNTARAKKDLDAFGARVTGRLQDQARVRLAAADYFAREDAAAYRALRDFRSTDPEVDAERYYYLISAARRLDREEEMSSLLRELGAKYPDSTWRREALVSVANAFLVQNKPNQYLPLYRAYYEAFPEGAQAAYCHWKVAWNQYLKREPGTADRLRYHVKNFPGDEKSAGALYFLGRLSEAARDYPAARAYYQAASRNYINFYYGVLSRKRLAEGPVAKAVAAPGVEEFLAAVPFPRPDFGGFDATPATRARIERSRLLYSAGLKEQAELEMRFGAKNDAQGHLLGMELAQRSVREGNPAQGLRWIKALAPTYLYMPLSAAPESFWRLAFPLPFKTALSTYSKAQSLDPYMVAALVRQESEFDPGAVSRANACGLTQVVPSTGRGISKKVGIRRFRPAMLFNPDTNLKLGTYYVRTLLNSLDGEWEAALASYNAGKSRVVNWKTWSDFREPAEFVETIPFSETRNYVQVVMRNADVYRRLYGENAHAALAAAPNIPVVLRKASYTPAHSVKSKAKGKAAVKKAASKRGGKKAASRKRHRARVNRS